MPKIDIIQRANVRDFAVRHQPESSLLLPKAWDVWSDRILEAAGFAPIGTTSGGIAYSCGYGDGQCTGRDEIRRKPINTVDPGERRHLGRPGVDVVASV